MNSLGRKVLVASFSMLVLLIGCYALVARELAEWNDASASSMLDFRRALLDAEIHSGLARTVGETASYALTGNTDYRSEATESLERARLAAAELRRIADQTAARSDVDHGRFLQRQVRLLQSAQAQLNQVSSAVSAGGPLRAAVALRSIYADEAERDALWQEITAHRQQERLDDEQALHDHGRRAPLLLLAGVATCTAMMGLFIAYVRWRVVGPLTTLAQLTTSVAAGDLTQRAELTHRDEIGQLQCSFNQMVVDLERQRRERSVLVESLARSRDAAQAANRAKSDFLANVSHEIRTPMNGVVVSLDLMHETAPDEELRRLAEVARTCARSLLGMLNDLLDFSRIEAGRLELESVTFEPLRLVTQMVELHGMRARAKGLVVTCQVAADVPARLNGDAMRLGQVLLNLLDNAIRYTERGSIDVSVSVDPPLLLPVQVQVPGQAAGRPVVLRLRVTDSGVGIPPEAAQKIFQPFYQVEGAAACNHGGVGLGLGIARQVARLMGGEIGFDSEVGKGSSFWFTARLLPDTNSGAEAAPAAQPRRQHPAGKAVLLVEDHSDTREVMARALRRRGLHVTTAEDGRVALALAAAADFDLVLMDCRMPNMDGFQATRAIRALGDGRATVPVVALTAYGLTEPKQHYLDAGFDDLVVKPYSLEDVETVLYRWLVLERRESVLPPRAKDVFAATARPSKRTPNPDPTWPSPGRTDS